jgi:hypothetical protein
MRAEQISLTTQWRFDYSDATARSFLLRASLPTVIYKIYKRINPRRSTQLPTWQTYWPRLLAELSNTMSEARYFSAGIVLMYDAALRRSHDKGLCCLESCKSRLAVSALDRFLDVADRISQRRAASLVHFGPARDHAGGFAGGLGIGHRSLVHSWRFDGIRESDWVLYEV